MNVVALLAALAVQSAVTNSVEVNAKCALSFRFADHAFRLEPGDRLRVDVASGCAQFAPHGNVRGEQAFVREPKVAHNRVFAEDSELVLHVK